MKMLESGTSSGPRSSVIGIVGAGPCGLYLAYRLLQTCPSSVTIHVFEANRHIGGRTRMTVYHHIPIVMGAGIIRHRDRRLRQLARDLHVPLHRFTTRIQYAFPIHPTSSSKIIQNILQQIKTSPLINRCNTFRENMLMICGESTCHHFEELVGATDYWEADVYDTIDDFGFQDNMPDQVMYRVDWNLLWKRLLEKCQQFSTFVLHRCTPITHVDVKCRAHFVLNTQWEVDNLFWTAPRPTWSLLPISSCRTWDSVLSGIACQSFLRAYAIPTVRDRKKAERFYPTTTHLPYGNPLQKIIPYQNNVYMIAYCDNVSADKVNYQRLFSQWSGIQWKCPKVFYHACGTHFFRPLATDLWTSREAFLAYAQHPLEALYLCGEAVTRDQGWTEGALESADQVIARYHGQKRAVLASSHISHKF